MLSKNLQLVSILTVVITLCAGTLLFAQSSGAQDFDKSSIEMADSDALRAAYGLGERLGFDETYVDQLFTDAKKNGLSDKAVVDELLQEVVSRVPGGLDQFAEGVRARVQGEISEKFACGDLEIMQKAWVHPCWWNPYFVCLQCCQDGVEDCEELQLPPLQCQNAGSYCFGGCIWTPF